MESVFSNNKSPQYFRFFYSGEQDKENMEYAVAILYSEDVFSPDISSLIANADGSFRRSQVMTSLLQPDLQESADLAL